MLQHAQNLHSGRGQKNAINSQKHAEVQLMIGQGIAKLFSNGHGKKQMVLLLIHEKRVIC